MMRLFSPRLFAVVLVVGCPVVRAQRPVSAAAKAAQAQVVLVPDDSELTKFLATKGIVTIQTHYPVTEFQTGKGQRLRVEGVVASAATGDRTVYKALRMVGPSTATIDLDEAQEFSRCLETFLVTAGQWNQTSPGNRTQLTFEAREGFQIQMTWLKTATTISMRMNDVSEARFVMDTTDLVGFKRAVDEALALLATK